MVLPVKRLTLRVKHLTLPVKQAFMTPMAYHSGLMLLFELQVDNITESQSRADKAFY